MTKSLNTIYLLWGAQFDELAAIMFITQLRKAGLRVQVVALSPPPIVGAFGQAIMADLTLHEALTLKDQVGGLVIPGTVKKLRRFQNDPRLTELLSALNANGVSVFISQQEQAYLNDLPFEREAILLYPEEQALISYIHQTIGRLQGEKFVSDLKEE